jgi:hypothetical protein
MILAAAALILAAASPAVAQEWIQFASKTDLFGVNFPTEPKTQQTTWTSEFGLMLPARVYSADSGASHYSVTVADYADAEKMHAARVAECKKNGGESDLCQNEFRGDVQGSIVFAAWKFIQRNAKVTYFAWAVTDNVEGQRVQLTNPDGSRTFAAIYRHGTKLYILEGTVPKGAPAPGLFQQSLMWLDEEGKPVRYRSLYTTGYSDAWKFPAPAPARLGGGPPPAAAPPPAAVR